MADPILRPNPETMAALTASSLSQLSLLNGTCATSHSSNCWMNHWVESAGMNSYCVYFLTHSASEVLNMFNYCTPGEGEQGQTQHPPTSTNDLNMSRFNKTKTKNGPMFFPKQLWS